MSRYGRYVTSRDWEWGEVGAGDQRACVFNTMPVNAWGTHLGAWLGKEPGGPSVSARLLLRDTDSSKNPDERMGHTNSTTVSTTLGDDTGEPGNDYVMPFSSVNSDFSPGSNAVKLSAGKRYSITIIAPGGLVRHSMIQSSRLPSGAADNRLFYDEYSTTLTDNAINYDNISTQGWLSAWIEYVANRKPTAATVAPAGIVTDTAPTFQGSFSDPDSTYGDKLKSYRIWVRRASDQAVMWTSPTFSASSSEQTAEEFSRAYGGDTLSQGIAYEWQCQVSDQFGEWSAVTAWQSFTISSGGAIVPSSFSGKQTTRQPGPFVADWSDQGGLDAVAVRLSILRGGDSVLYSGEKAISVADGGTISIDWATAFGASSLSWGVSNYEWIMQAKNSAGLWTEAEGFAFSTNAAPAIPSGLTPNNDKASSSYPDLECSCTDADPDDALLTVKARIKDAGGSLITTVLMSYNASRGKYHYQTSAAELAAFAAYRWDAYSFDGDLYSGEAALEADAVKSAEASFVFADGPVIDISAPAADAVLTSSSVDLAWSLTSGGPQVSYQVALYRADDDALVYDSGTVISAVGAHTIPSGYVLDNTSYYAIVTVTAASTLTASSSARAFSIDYIEPAAPASFSVLPAMQRFDYSASANRLTWEATALPNFLEYIIGRRESGQDVSEEVILERPAAQSIIEWVDYHPAPATDYIYSLRVSETQGLDIVTSERTEFSAVLELENVVLVSIDDPASSRVALVLEEERSAELMDDLELDRAWGEAEPIANYGEAEFDVISGRFRLVDDGTATAREYIAAARALRRRKGTISYRDGRDRAMFCVISKFRETDARIDNYELELELTEVSHEEGELG